MGELVSFTPDTVAAYQTDGALAFAGPYAEDVVRYTQAGDLYEGQFDDDLYQINQLRKYYDRSLAKAGIREYVDPTGKPDNYDLVLARWNFERCNTFWKKEKYKREELRNIETSVAERVRVEKSEFEFYIDEKGKMWSKLLNSEPLVEIYERGNRFKQADYERKKLSSPEPKRDEEEVEGQRKIQAYFADPKTPVGAIMIDISGRGLAENTTNNDNFVDFYRLLMEVTDAEGRVIKRIISYTRFTSNLDYDAYEKIALKLNPNYLEGFRDENGKEIMPRDAWFKGRPLLLENALMYKSNQEAFDAYFVKDITTKTTEKFKALWGNLLPYALYLREGLIAKVWDPAECAKRKHAIRAVLEEYQDGIQGDSEVAESDQNIWLQEFKEELEEKADNENKEYTHFVTEYHDSISEPPINVYYLAQRVEAYTYRQVQSVNVGCGSFGGMTFAGKMGTMTETNTLLANTVGRYAFPGMNETSKEKEGAYCQDCPPPPSLLANDGSDGHYHCPKPNCKKFYANEEGKSEFTPECKCGYTFHCAPNVVSLEEYREKKQDQSKR